MRREPIPLWAGRFALPGDDGMSGLGDIACPDIAPYPNLAYPGRCTNIPTAQQNATGDYSQPVAPPVEAGPAPINSAIVQSNADSRFGLQLTQDRTTQEQLAAEVIAEGLASSCEIVHNTAPAGDGGVGASSLWQALCNVPGQTDRNSAAQILRLGRSRAAAPSTKAPVAVPTTSAGATAPTSTGSGAPLPATAGAGFDPSSLLTTAQTQLSNLSASTGLPSWALLAAAGVALFMVAGGER